MKKNKVKIYAKALAGAILGKKTSENKIVANFVNLLIKTDQEKKAKEILTLTEDLLLRKQGKKKIVFEMARRLTPGNKSLLKQFVKEGDVVKEKINHQLIAGVKIVVNNEKQFDNSMQAKIQRIFN